MELFKDVSAVPLFIAFFVPGFLMIKVWEWYVPSQAWEWDKRIPEAVAYSALYYGFTLWPYFLLHGPYANGYVYVDVFVLPIAAALVVTRVRGIALTGRRGIQPTPWDQLFYRINCDRVLSNGVKLALVTKSGVRLCGYFGKKSYASTFPSPGQIYLQRLTDPDSDRPLEPATGALINCAELEYILVQAR